MIQTQNYKKTYNIQLLNIMRWNKHYLCTTTVLTICITIINRSQREKARKAQQTAAHQCADKKQKTQSQGTAEVVPLVMNQEELVKDDTTPNRVCVYKPFVINTFGLFSTIVKGCREQEYRPVSSVCHLSSTIFIEKIYLCQCVFLTFTS